MNRVLVIDDDPTTCRLVALMLERRGYAVDTANSVPDAWDVLKQELPDLIFLDLMMPDPNGLVFLEMRQSIPSLAAIPVVALTAVGDKRWLDDAIRLGASAILRKPVGLGEIAAAAESALAPAPA